MTDTRTIEVIGFFGKPKQVTKTEFVAAWRSHASELLTIGVNVMEETQAKAEAEFDKVYAQQSEKAA